MLVLAYILGSVSSAILVSRLFKLPDPRSHGSNNPGATNVYRLGGKVPAVLVLVFDILKGTIPVWGAYFLKIDPLMLGLIGVAACLGHMYPLFFSFKGGKAVATAFGTLLPIGLSLGGMLIATWLIIVAITRYSSLAALVTVSLSASLYMVDKTFVYLASYLFNRVDNFPSQSKYYSLDGGGRAKSRG